MCAQHTYNVQDSARWSKVTIYDLETGLDFLLNSECLNGTNYPGFWAPSSFLHWREVINRSVECGSEDAGCTVSSIGFWSDGTVDSFTIVLYFFLENVP